MVTKESFVEETEFVVRLKPILKVCINKSLILIYALNALIPPRREGAVVQRCGFCLKMVENCEKFTSYFILAYR